MSSVLLLFLRRMRSPLLALICAYGVSILGLTLIPGQDDAGQTWHMSFFHAFYTVSYTATTIGFGEIPYPLSDGQRLWLVLCVYLTVISWLYAIGQIFTLFKEPAFQRLMAASGFAREVRALREPFYIVCGFGETGSRIVDALDRLGLRSAVIEVDADRVAELDLQGYAANVPGLTGDAQLVENLSAAGLNLEQCKGVLALTDDDQANLGIAVAAKLLRPKLPVLARCESKEVATNLAAFGTDYVINPFEMFGRQLAESLEAPHLHILTDWLTGAPGEIPPPPVLPPRGLWVVCGYGRMGREVVNQLERDRNEVRVIESDADMARDGEGLCGLATENEILQAAHIEQAVGLVAGTASDVNNLAIAMKARQVNPSLFVVLRRNHERSTPLFEAMHGDLVMEASRVTAAACVAALTSPAVTRFLAVARREGDLWAREVLGRLAGVVGERLPAVWTVDITPVGASAAYREISRGNKMRLEHLLLDPYDRTKRLPVFPLLATRERTETLCPEDALLIAKGDRLLFCGPPEAAQRQRVALFNERILHYAVTGEIPHGTVWRWFLERAA